MKKIILKLLVCIISFGPILASANPSIFQKGIYKGYQGLGTTDTGEVHLQVLDDGVAHLVYADGVREKLDLRHLSEVEDFTSISHLVAGIAIATTVRVFKPRTENYPIFVFFGEKPIKTELSFSTSLLIISSKQQSIYLYSPSQVEQGLFDEKVEDLEEVRRQMKEMGIDSSFQRIAQPTGAPNAKNCTHVVKLIIEKKF